MQSSSVEENRRKNRLVTGRELCERCRRPASACYCAHVRPVDTRTRLVLLQHPRERYVAIGTAHMASLCLQNSELHVGVDWSQSAPLARALSDPERPAILLYPGADAIDLAANPPSGPVTLVVVDGTWALTKKVVRINPILRSLPRYAFVPSRPSEYRIRREPNDESVATIEALVHALEALENVGAPPERHVSFETLLAPFRAMIDHQIACEARFRGTQSRHAARRARVRRMRVPRVFSDRFADLLFVAGEASSWPYAMRSEVKYDDELVQWAAFRPSTGETFSFVTAPERQLAPGTAKHTGLAEETILAGGTRAELHERWRAFVRDTDVICSWGRYETSLFAKADGYLPAERLDLRAIARDVGSLESTGPRKKKGVGALYDYRSTLPGAGGDSAGIDQMIIGRAGRKLDAIDQIVRSFVTTLERAGVRDR